MNQTPFDPEHPPDETDRTLDLYLASLPRFHPSPGFTDRVMARVVMQAPASAPVRRWPVRRAARILAALSGAAAVSSTALTAGLVANFEALAATATSVVAAWGLTVWNAALAAIPEVGVWAGDRLAAIVLGAGPVTAAGVVAGAVVSIPIGLFGLYLAARPPLHSRMVPNAAP